MSIKPVSLSTLADVCRYLLKTFESENLLPQGLFENPERVLKSKNDFNPIELQVGIFDSIDLLRQGLLNSTAAVCRHHNSLLPIHKLPPEILSTCITHALVEVEPHNHQRRVVQLSTISSWWRQVTLRTPSLWGVISSKNPEWIISLALDRSKEAPLTFFYEGDSLCSNLYGGKSQRRSIAADDFFRSASPHMGRWGDATFPILGSSSSSINWLDQHPIQLSRHLRQLNLCCQSGRPITRFTGDAERLLELKLHNLTVCPKDIIRIIASSPRMITLDLQSLVASIGPENQAEPVDIPPTPIDLPCLTTLLLKNLPSSILGPVVNGIDISKTSTVHIVHSTTTQGNAFDDQDKSCSDSLASFIPRLIATASWVRIQLYSSGIILKPSSRTTCHYTVELQGMHSVLLPWLRLDSLSRVTRRYRVELRISSFGDNPGQALIETLMRFPRVGSVYLDGRREAWRWISLLSLPDAVQTDSGDSDKKTTKSWLWPDLEYLNISGESINEFTLLSVLLARYGSSSASGSTSRKEGMPRRLLSLEVRPGGKVMWRAEVVDRIKERVGPGCFKWMRPS